MFWFALTPCLAITWDEPWQETILEKAEYFVLGEVLEVDEREGFAIEVIKYFGTQKIEGKVQIAGFYLLNICSNSGQYPEFNFEKGTKIYFFLKKGKDNTYQIPTPTSGFAFTNGEKVMATYRHSYHQAMLYVKDFEPNYTEIWNYYRTGKYDTKKVEAFLDEQLNKRVFGADNGELPNMFLQHAALETIYHLKINNRFQQIVPFVQCKDVYHARISGIRALKYYDSEEAKKLLIEVINKREESVFNKSIASQVLVTFEKNKLSQKELKDLLEVAPSNSADFGGNIMDNRVCTHLPAPKSVLLSLDKK
jgi:hypothetical protein